MTDSPQTVVIPAEDEPTDPIDGEVTGEGAPREGDGEAPRRRRWHVLLVFPGVLAVAAAVLLTLDLKGLGWDWFSKVVLHGPARENFVLDTFMLCVLLGFFVFVLGRFWIPAALFGVAGVLVAYAHGIKVHVRREPIYPSDLAVAGNTGFLKDMVSRQLIIEAVLSVAAILAVALVLGFLLRKVLPRVRRKQDPVFWRRLLIARVVCALMCGAILVDAVWFNTPGNLVRKAYDRIGSDWIHWDQERNYRRNGFVGGFLYNLNGPVMTRPPGYSKAAVEDVVERYTALARTLNAGRDPKALDGVNIVVVLSEAFSDPLRLKGLQYDGDPIPYTRQLMTQTASGNMLAQLIGGGTANMEFEVLTGLSLAQFAPQMTTPYQMLLPHFHAFPGAVRYLEAQGHRPIAVHPYSTRMYKRTTAYPVLGFKEFIYNATMSEKAKQPRGRFISDQSAFDEVQHQLATSAEPMFLNLVTMQNHYPWNKEFTEPWPMTGISGLALQQASRYARGINYTDAALQQWLGEMRQSSEKTAVVFYGDHLPGAYPQRILKLNGDRVTHETPYFLWTNFKQLKHTPQPTTSPIYFLPMLFDQLDAPLPPMYALLHELHQQIPAMEQGKYFDATDKRVKEKDLSPEAKRLLRDYRMIQFDLVQGKRYSEKAIYTLP